MARKPKSGQMPDPEDTGLWDRVKRTVDPLDEKQRQLYSQALADYLASGAPTRPLVQTDGSKPKTAANTKLHQSPGANHATRKKPPVRGSANPPLVDLDRRARSRIARGRTPIDARLDLHGMRQHEAHDVLRSFIWRCHSAGHRTVLVITGKGSRARDPGPEAPPWAMGTGILRRAVPGWLAASDLRAAVLSVETAHASHGGEGALYVRLRARPSDKNR